MSGLGGEFSMVPGKKMLHLGCLGMFGGLFTHQGQHDEQALNPKSQKLTLHPNP